MLSNRYVPNFRLCQFKLAYEYNMITQLHKRRSKTRSAIRYFLNLNDVLMDDRYAQEYFDYVILGDDPLLAVMAALNLGMQQKSVLIFPTRSNTLTEDYQGVLLSRSHMFNPYFYTRAGFDVPEDPSLEDFFSGVLERIGDIKFDDKRPGIMITDHQMGLHSYGTSKAPYEAFWTEPHQDTLNASSLWQKARQKLTRLSHYGHENNSRSDSIPKCKVVAKHVIVTTPYSEDLTLDLTCKVSRIGEAERPLKSFEHFTIRDRIYDFLETELFRH
ncbi:hypothetical protein ACI2KR_30020 [Pseudomonas luteola]